MTGQAFKLALLLSQAFWMLVVLPGHVRGLIVIGPDVRAAAVADAADAADACCAGRTADGPDDTPSPDRQKRCAVCNQAMGYDLPPVYDVDLVPTGLCELCRLIEPGTRCRRPCEAVYFANAPPAGLA